jgi:hypothetical protein
MKLGSLAVIIYVRSYINLNPYFLYLLTDLGEIRY